MIIYAVLTFFCLFDFIPAGLAADHPVFLLAGAPFLL